MVKVSVVVPVYNVEKYLERCLETLANQTMKELEIIVVNDGSTDKSQTIIERYELEYPGRVKSFWKEKTSEGPSEARNFGICYCKGEYIGFIDADDYIERDMFEKLYKKAQKENCDIVFCDYVKEYTSKQELVKARQYDSPKDMFIGGLAMPWNKLYKREFLERIKLQFPIGLIYEDTEFFCCLVPHIERWGYVEGAFVHYVQRRGSLVNSQENKMAMIFTVFDHILSYYRERGMYEEYRHEIEYFSVRVLFGSSMERICRFIDPQIRKDLLYRTWDYGMERFPGWKKNKYLRPVWKKRNLYLHLLSRSNLVLFGTILRKYFLYKEKKLFGQ